MLFHLTGLLCDCCLFLLLLLLLLLLIFQAGDLMAKSSHNPRVGKARFLSPADLREIERVTAGVRAIGSPEYIIPGSLGAPVPE